MCRHDTRQTLCPGEATAWGAQERLTEHTWVGGDTVMCIVAAAAVPQRGAPVPGVSIRGTQLCSPCRELSAVFARGVAPWGASPPSVACPGDVPPASEPEGVWAGAWNPEVP